MQFQFQGLSDFLSMSGHGPYVWFCYVITALVMMYLAISPVLRRRRMVVEIERRQHREKNNLERAQMNILTGE